MLKLSNIRTWTQRRIFLFKTLPPTKKNGNPSLNPLEFFINLPGRERVKELPDLNPHFFNVVNLTIQEKF